LVKLHSQLGGQLLLLKSWKAPPLKKTPKNFENSKLTGCSTFVKHWSKCNKPLSCWHAVPLFVRISPVFFQNKIKIASEWEMIDMTLEMSKLLNVNSSVFLLTRGLHSAVHHLLSRSSSSELNSSTSWTVELFKLGVYIQQCIFSCHVPALLSWIAPPLELFSFSKHVEISAKSQSSPTIWIQQWGFATNEKMQCCLYSNTICSTSLISWIF